MMRLTPEEAEAIEGCLDQIYEQILFAMNDRDRFQIRQYIYVGEYGLALDELADIILEIGKPMAPELRRLFNTAADKMEIKPGDGWSTVDNLRKFKK